MQSVIRLLPESLANQIAAGEVVQRPASVVKELLENSIDAQATKIELIIEDAGKGLIQVIDDGMGMSPADALMAFERHATSKIYQLDDLFKINTMGFRGEALASIAAVAQVKMKTRLIIDELATEIEIAGGHFKSNQPSSFSKGTSISVRNLFFNVPARRNFLKSNHVEFRHILTEWKHVALAYPQIAIKLIHNNDLLFDLPVQSFIQRIMSLYPNQISTNDLKSVHHQIADLQINGYVGLSALASKQRGDQYFFVNNRFIRSSLLHSAVMKVMGQLLEADKHPFYVICLTVPPETIDINIHPTKAEIKFTDEHNIYSQLFFAVRDAIVLPENQGGLTITEKPTSMQVMQEYYPSYASTKSDSEPKPPVESTPYRDTFYQQMNQPATRSNFPKANFPWDEPPLESTTITKIEHKPFQTEKGIIAGEILYYPQYGGLLVVHGKRLILYYFQEQIRQAMDQPGTVRHQTLLFPISKRNKFPHRTAQLQKIGFQCSITEDQVNIQGYPHWLPAHLSVENCWDAWQTDDVNLDVPEYIINQIRIQDDFNNVKQYFEFWVSYKMPFYTEDEQIIAYVITNEEINQRFLI